MTLNNLSNTPDPNLTPLEPPDSNPPHLKSFKSKLLASDLMADLPMEDCVDINNRACPEVSINEGVEELSNVIKIITLSKDDTVRLCSP